MGINLIQTIYRIAQNVGSCRVGFGDENVGEYTIATISYYSESGIWLGKILANDNRFTKFTKVLRYTEGISYPLNR